MKVARSMVEARVMRLDKQLLSIKKHEQMDLIRKRQGK